MALRGNPRISIQAEEHVSKATRDAEKSLGRLEKSGDKTARRLKAAAGVMAGAFAVDQIAGFARTAIDTASDIDESLTKNEALFGRHAGTVERWSRTTADSIGVSRATALEATGTFGGLFEALQIGDKPAADMSVRLTRLAADLASFNNASPEEALEALRSGLSGEAEPMRRFNAFLSEGRVKAEAYARGLAKPGAELTEQQKIQARYFLILKDTNKAHGDFAKTSGGLANQQRTLKAQLSDVTGELGKELLPAANDAAKALTRFIRQMREGKGAGGDFADAARKVANVVGDVVGFLKDHPKLIAAAVAAWATYKGASVVALGAIKVQAFRKAFGIGKGAAAAEGAIAGRLYATSFAATSATAMPGALGKQKGRFVAAAAAIGRWMGPVAAAVFIAEFGPRVATGLWKETKSRLSDLGDLAGDTFDALLGNGPPPRGSENGFGNPAGRGDPTPLSPNFPPGSRLPKPDREGNGPRRRPGSSRPRGQRHGGHASTARVSARGSAVAHTSATYSQAQIAQLWVRAGGNPAAADIASAIAMAESGGNSGAINASNSDGSIDRGLWQINSVHGTLSTTDPMGNARAAVRISGNGTNWSPWVVYQTGAYRRFLGGSGNAGANAPTGGAGEGTRSGSGARNRPPSLSRAQRSARSAFRASQRAAIRASRRGLAATPAGRSTLEWHEDRMAAVDVDLALAEGTPSTQDDQKAIFRKAWHLRRRLDVVKRKLKNKKLSRSARQTLLHEQAQIIRDLRQVGEDNTTLLNPETDAPTELDFLNRHLAVAEVDGNTAGQLDALRGIEGFWTRKLLEAQGTADPRDDIEAAGGLSSVREAIKSLDESIQQANRLQEQDRALREEDVELRRRLVALTETQGPQLLAAVIAAVNGGIGGGLGLAFQSAGVPGTVGRA